MSNEYDFRTVADFQNVPADKINECMADFASLLKFWHESTRLGIESVGVKVIKDRFIWVDDGDRGISEVIIYPKEEG